LAEFVGGPSKSQCDAPLSTTERTKSGTARAMERPLPKYQHIDKTSDNGQFASGNLTHDIMLATMKYAVDYYKSRATAAGWTAPRMT
jgi:hypothetical protein